MEREVDSIDSLRALGKKYSIELLAAAEEPGTAKEFEERLDIPTATCYRRLEELTRHGLLEHEGSVVTDEVRSSDVYRRSVEEITITFSGGEPTLTVRERSRVESKLDAAWNQLTD